MWVCLGGGGRWGGAEVVALHRGAGRTPPANLPCASRLALPRAAVSAGPPAHRLLALAQGHQGLPGAVLGEEQLLLAPLLLAPLLAPRCVQTGAEGSGSWAARAGGSWAARAGGSVRAGRLRAFTTFTPAHIRPLPPSPLPSPPLPHTTQIGYEPYILMHRDYVPFYDERFRGYYW